MILDNRILPAGLLHLMVRVQAEIKSTKNAPAEAGAFFVVTRLGLVCILLRKIKDRRRPAVGGNSPPDCCI